MYTINITIFIVTKFVTTPTLHGKNSSVRLDKYISVRSVYSYVGTFTARKEELLFVEIHLTNLAKTNYYKNFVTIFVLQYKAADVSS